MYLNFEAHKQSQNEWNFLVLHIVTHKEIQNLTQGFQNSYRQDRQSPRKHITFSFLMIVNPRKYSDLQKFSQIPINYVEKLQGRSAIPFSFTIVVKNAPCVKGRAQCVIWDQLCLHFWILYQNFYFFKAFRGIIYEYYIFEKRQTYGKCYNFLHTNHLISRRFLCFTFICHLDVN